MTAAALGGAVSAAEPAGAATDGADEATAPGAGCELTLLRPSTIAPERLRRRGVRVRLADGGAPALRRATVWVRP